MKTGERVGAERPPELPKPGTPAWWQEREERAARSRRGRLDERSIVDAALEILDAEGLDALTMRRLAHSLGTAPSSLYRHIRSAHELRVLIVNRVVAEVDFLGPDRDWRERIQAAARSYRVALERHPNAVPLFGQGIIPGPTIMRARDTGVSILVSAGMSPRRALLVFMTLADAVLGMAMVTMQSATEQAVETTAEQMIHGADPDRYPTLAALAGGFVEPAAVERFEFVVTALLDRVEQEIRRTPWQPRSAGA